MLPDLILPLMEDKVDLTSILCNMTRRTNVVDNRNNRVALFDGIEEGGIRAQSLYSSSHEIDEHDNEQAMDGLQDRVNLLKRLSGDIQEEVDSHNRMLDRMGNDMDSSRGILSGTMDKFKMVFETKSSRRMFTLVASFVVLFLIVYYLTSLPPLPLLKRCPPSLVKKLWCAVVATLPRDRCLSSTPHNRIFISPEAREVSSLPPLLLS
ncbi:hypothetical protein AHAS_Ahas06G0118100 [Arachis hypogaea]